MRREQRRANCVQCTMKRGAPCKPWCKYCSQSVPAATAPLHPSGGQVSTRTRRHTSRVTAPLCKRPCPWSSTADREIRKGCGAINRRVPRRLGWQMPDRAGPRERHEVCVCLARTCCSKTSASAFKNSRIRDFRSSIISLFSCSSSAAIFFVSARCRFPTSVTSFEFAHSQARMAWDCSLMPMRRSVMACRECARSARPRVRTETWRAAWQGKASRWLSLFLSFFA